MKWYGCSKASWVLVVLVAALAIGPGPLGLGSRILGGVTTAASVSDPQRQPANLAPAVKTYTVTAGRERLEFVPQPEKGYVVRTTAASSQESVVGRSGTEDAATAPLVLPRHAKPIGGLGRRGVYTVESNGPAAANEKTIAELRKQGQVAYIAPLFSSNGETVAIIPEIVIRVHPGVDERQVHFLCESKALAVIKPMEFTTQEYLLQVLGPDAEAVFAALENLNKVEWIEWAAPNTAFTAEVLWRACDERLHSPVNNCRSLRWRKTPTARECSRMTRTSPCSGTYTIRASRGYAGCRYSRPGGMGDHNRRPQHRHCCPRRRRGYEPPGLDR